MSEIIGDMLWLIPGLPLAASILIALFGPRLLRGQSHLPCVLASVASCLLAATATFAMAPLVLRETGGAVKQLRERNHT